MQRLSKIFSKKKIIAGVLGLFVIVILICIIVSVFTGKPELSYADFKKDVETTLYTQSVELNVEKTSNSDGTYTYTLSPANDQGAEFTVETEQDYSEATITGTRYEFEMVYDDYTPFTDYIYVTELGNSDNDEHYSKIIGMDYSKEMRDYFDRYFTEVE